MGVCNGFQSLVQLKVFGENVRLLGNEKSGIPQPFVNRWVDLSLELPSSDALPLRLPLRHGEGRLDFTELGEGVSPFLYYRDNNFENGSRDRIAGLRGEVASSHFLALMPHPEIALRPFHSPNTSGPDYVEKARLMKWDLRGDGVVFFERLAKLLSWELSAELSP